MTEPILIAVIGGAFAIGGSVLTALFTRRKSRADAASSISTAAANLVKGLNERLDDLESENKVLRLEISKIQSKLNELQDMVQVYQKRFIYLVQLIKDLFAQFDEHQIKPRRNLPKWAEEYDHGDVE
jgi:peptidoglycan hydrolase CwlO-like protein